VTKMFCMIVMTLHMIRNVTGSKRSVDHFNSSVVLSTEAKESAERLRSGRSRPLV